MNKNARVLFFANLRDRTGVRETTLEFSGVVHISDIKTMILEKYPSINDLMDSIIVAVNHEFAFDEDIVPDGAEIAMFPPVSGGAAQTVGDITIAVIVDHEIDVNRIAEEITQPTTGGLCVFLGTVREITVRDAEVQTEHLVYEAYTDMAEAKLRQICAEIRSQWKDVEGIALVQRTGKLSPGTISVMVACASAHRDEGIFEAARYGIDRLKEIVPVWKKEVGKDGEEWVEGKYFPQKGE